MISSRYALINVKKSLCLYWLKRKNMQIKYLLVLLTGLFFHANILADSPLTSTNFSKAYKDAKIVQLAAVSNGSISELLMDYLIYEDNPIDLKIAAINELGWSLRGKNNAGLFYAYMKYRNVLEDIDQASADILICYAYFMALDDYFDVEEAIVFANKAKAKNPSSYTIQIITALIEAQKALDNKENWCEVYSLTNRVRNNKALTQDMNEEAIAIIFKYMDLYKENCD